MKVKNLSASLILVIFFSPLLYPQQQSTVSIYGVVKDSASGHPLAGVRVEAINEADSSHRASAITGSDGHYSLSLTATAQSIEIPNEFRLLQNYPNPFNPSTLIGFELAKAAEVRLDIYNTLGQKIRTLLNRQLGPGSYTVEWDARNDAGMGVAAGVYFYRLRADNFMQTRKMVLMDGAAGQQAASAVHPDISNGVLTKHSNPVVTIRAVSPEIEPYEQSQVELNSHSLQVNIGVAKQNSFLDRDKIIVSDPGADGRVYVSGLPGAVVYPITPDTRSKIVTVGNLRTQDKNSGLTNNHGGFAPISVSAAVEDLLQINLELAEGKSGAPLILEVEDNVPPNVVGTKPTDGDKDIIVDQIIIVGFSEPIDTNTVNLQTFTLSDSSGTFVPGTIGFPADTAATFDPTNPLAYNSRYTITVTKEVMDLQGLHLDSTATATFTTEAPQVINVPGDFPTIQGGIDVANDGDTVLVADGVYLENINFMGKAITVASHFIMDGDTNHINNTIIDGSQPSHPDSGSVVFFISGEDTNSLICGFTITGGSGTITQFVWYGEVRPSRAGGGIFCFHSGARIVHNKITGNIISYNEESVGGGVAGFPVGNAGYIIIEDNQIENNTLTGNHSHGPAICLTCNGAIINNDINHNSADAIEIVSGSVDCWTDSATTRYVVIRKNRISKNTLTASAGLDLAGGGGIGLEDGMSVLILDNEIFNNRVNAMNIGRGGGVYLENPSEEVIITGNRISGNIVSANNESRGGGIAAWDATSSNDRKFIFNNIISENAAATGGGIFCQYTNVINNTILNNTASSAGGGIRAPGVTSIILNTIFWNNHAGAYPQISGAVDVRYSNIEGGYPGTGNIDADPLFADTLLYNLSDSSLCIGAGIDSVQIGGTLVRRSPGRWSRESSSKPCRLNAGYRGDGISSRFAYRNFQ